ncbi:MAG: helix-turn-helix transcriptional regulator [Lewinellaceae bacterium]|nr:helix-turn-helix transcriptional regulator [Phaeodactylibacter sp.]MCB9042042.1 helix-turn-helix transcriptional regulator [Lewinellaceae bacterium]
MKGTHLGEFEELVLLVVGILTDEAYGVAVAEEIEKQTGRSVSLSPVHSALYRLEEKGYVESELGGATKTRGGRRKRIYQLTTAGRAALEETRMIRNRLWNMLPD